MFWKTHVTPAARANDTTDVWAVRHGCYTREPSQPFRSASIDHIQCGEVECDRDGSGSFTGANLGLYSITFVNELDQDREAAKGWARGLHINMDGEGGLTATADTADATGVTTSHTGAGEASVPTEGGK